MIGPHRKILEDSFQSCMKFRKREGRCQLLQFHNVLMRTIQEMQLNWTYSTRVLALRVRTSTVVVQVSLVTRLSVGQSGEKLKLFWPVARAPLAGQRQLAQQSIFYVLPKYRYRRH
jgi:hypothetical protein